MSEMKLSAALADIAAERKRQIEREGWAPEHDDTHKNGELLRAAACYCLRTTTHAYYDFAEFWLKHWPWAREWWKPTTRRRNLIKAAALIVAEIDRLDRATARE